MNNTNMNNTNMNNTNMNNTNMNNTNMKKRLKRIINYNMNITDLEKIIKLNKIDKQNEFRKNYTTKNKNKYKKIFKTLSEDFENNSNSDITDNNSSIEE
jgi:hypothetical protein